MSVMQATSVAFETSCNFCVALRRQVVGAVKSVCDGIVLGQQLRTNYRVAEHLARFHASARADDETARHGAVAAIRRNVAENFSQTRQSAPRVLDRSALAEIEDWQLGFLERHADLFARRIADGRIREGHGDLRLEHVYLGPGDDIQVIDCIEFNERFRHGDVEREVAELIEAR